MVSLFNLGPNDNRSNSDIEAATFSQLGRRTRQPTTGAYSIRQYCFTSGVSPRYHDCLYHDYVAFVWCPIEQIGTFVCVLRWHMSPVVQIGLLPLFLS